MAVELNAESTPMPDTNISLEERDETEDKDTVKKIPEVLRTIWKTRSQQQAGEK